MGNFEMSALSGKDVHVARLRALVAVLLLCAVLGCEDEPTPDIADPTESTSAPTPTETESTPTTSPTPEPLTPEETVRAWVDARNQALQSGDTSLAESLSDPTCETCEDSLAPIRQVYEDGGYYDTEGWALAGTPKTTETPTGATVTTGVVYAAGKTVPAEGESPVSYDVEKHIVEFRLTNDSGVWLLTFIGYIS